jgi:hypothetical protein
VEAQLAARSADAAEIAATAYRTGRLSAVSLLLEDGASSNGLLDRAAVLQSVAARASASCAS